MPCVSSDEGTFDFDLLWHGAVYADFFNDSYFLIVNVSVLLRAFLWHLHPCYCQATLIDWNGRYRWKILSINAIYSTTHTYWRLQSVIIYSSSLSLLPLLFRENYDIKMKMWWNLPPRHWCSPDTADGYHHWLSLLDGESTVIGLRLLGKDSSKYNVSFNCNPIFSFFFCFSLFCFIFKLDYKSSLLLLAVIIIIIIMLMVFDVNIKVT